MILEVKNIAKSFGGVKAVNDYSFAVEEGRITALIGPNGAGKTTLFNIINGFIQPDAGIITFQHLNITTLSPWRRSRLGMSRTFQLSRLFKNLSIKDNLLLSARTGDDLFWKNFLGKRDESQLEAKIYEAKDFVGLKKDLNAGITDISYGEQKLFDLTRALVNPHSFLLLDEVVAGVNPVIREKLKKLMGKLKEKGETILLIEHDMDFVRSVADWVIVMDQGTVLTEGEPEKVLREKKVLEAYLGVT